MCVYCGLCAGRSTRRTPSREVDCISLLFFGGFVGVKDSTVLKKTASRNERERSVCFLCLHRSVAAHVHFQRMTRSAFACFSLLTSPSIRFRLAAKVKNTLSINLAVLSAFCIFA